MKLSEAIRMNGMMKPQGFGSSSILSPDAPCALGGALQSIGKTAADQPLAFGVVRDVWPFVGEHLNACPAGPCRVWGKLSENILAAIWHLNDDHRWTRSQIADWLELIELHEAPIPEEQAELVTRLSA